MTQMSSGEAHGWMFVDLINMHLADHIPDEWDKRWLAAHGLRITPYLSTYCAECCGPCHALKDFWNTPRGRAEAQTYVNQLSKDNRHWTWCPDGVIDWAHIEQRMAEGFCPNHDQE